MKAAMTASVGCSRGGDSITQQLQRGCDDSTTEIVDITHGRPFVDGANLATVLCLLVRNHDRLQIIAQAVLCVRDAVTSRVQPVYEDERTFQHDGISILQQGTCYMQAGNVELMFPRCSIQG